MANYDSIDAAFTWDGDFAIGLDGDIKDNRDDHIQSLETEIHTILRSEFDDWQLDPGVGANLSDFRGEPNNQQIGELIEERVVSRIVATGIVRLEDIQARVVPVGRHQVMVMISVNATSTPGNRLSATEPLQVNLIYDSLEDSTFFLEESLTARNARTF